MHASKYHLAPFFLILILSGIVQVQADDPSGEITITVREDSDYNIAKFSVSVTNTGSAPYVYNIALWNNRTQMIRETQKRITPSEGPVEMDIGTHPCGLFDKGVEARLLSTDGSQLIARSEANPPSCGPLDAGTEGRKCNEICGDGLLGLALCDADECRLDSNNAGLNCWGHRVDLFVTVCSSCSILNGECKRYSDLTFGTSTKEGLDEKRRVCEDDDCGLDCEWDEVNRECVAAGGSNESKDVFTFFDDLASTMGQMTCNIYCYVLYLAASIAIVYMAVTGFKYMTSGDDEAARVEARTRFVYILVGLMILAVAYPIIQLIFVDTEIGFYKCKCGEFYIGEGSSLGRIPSENEKNFGTDISCTDSATCSTELSNYFYCSTLGKCFGKREEGEACDIKWEINSLNKVCYPGYSCSSGICREDKSEVMDCTDHSECESGKYCRMDATTGLTYCTNKKAIDSSCSASESVDSNPDRVCASDWCVGGKCVNEKNCDNTNDCLRHSTFDYCGTDWYCHTKVVNGEKCDNSQVVEGDANLMCMSKFCDVTGIVDPHRPGRCQDKP